MYRKKSNNLNYIILYHINKYITIVIVQKSVNKL